MGTLGIWRWPSSTARNKRRHHSFDTAPFLYSQRCYKQVMKGIKQQEHSVPREQKIEKADILRTGQVKTEPLKPELQQYR